MILSRRDSELIKTLFELEVPEIADGLVEIRGVAREPGYRSKIAVESHAQGVDPVGACVGPRGSRVRMVVSELRGEKIDIIPWNAEPARFIAKALSPARVREVLVDDESREATVVVPDDQLSLAIGKEGLNARLAARLTGWKVDIESESDFARAEAAAAFGGDVEGDDDFSGRCSAILSNGKRCPNAALPNSRYCGIPEHAALVDAPPAEAAAPVAEEAADGSRRRSRKSRFPPRWPPRAAATRRVARLTRRDGAGQDVRGLPARGAAGGAAALHGRGRDAGRGRGAAPAGPRGLHAAAARSVLFEGGASGTRSRARCARRCRFRTA